MPVNRGSAQHLREAKLDVDSPIGLDAYSSDGVFIGRVSGYLPAVAEDEQAVEEGHTDVIDQDGRPVGSRHLLIEGSGTVVQSRLIVVPELLEIDVPGRRVVVPHSIAQIEAMPHHDPAR